MGRSPGRGPAVTGRSRRLSVTIVITLGILLGEALPIGTAVYLTNRANHQWCALVDVLNSGPARPTTGYGLKVARAFGDRARSLGC